MSMTDTKQAQKLRKARDAMDMTNEQLAEALGVSHATLRNWLHPETSKAHRPMPRTAELLLAHVLAAHKSNAKK